MSSTGNKTYRSTSAEFLKKIINWVKDARKGYLKSLKTKPLVAQKTSKSIGFNFYFKQRHHFDWHFSNRNFYSYQTKTILHFHVVDYLWLLFSQTRGYPGTFREPTFYCLCWEWANVMKRSGGACVRPQAESHWVWPEIKMCRMTSYPASPHKTVIEDFEIKI